MGQRQVDQWIILYKDPEWEEREDDRWLIWKNNDWKLPWLGEGYRHLDPRSPESSK